MNNETVLYIGDRMPGIRRLKLYLKEMGLEFRKVISMSAATQLMEKQSFVLVLIQFEDMDKHPSSLYSFIRRESPGTIVMVVMTEMRPEIESKLFEYGVDDIAADKQTCPLVLAARIKRRYYSGKVSWSAAKKLMLKGGIVVNYARREVHVNGSTHTFKDSVEKLLKLFMSNPDRVITRDMMWKCDIWDMSVARADKEQQGKTFDMAIGKLRSTIEIDPKNPQIIKTVHGKGWMLARDAVL